MTDGLITRKSAVSRISDLLILELHGERIPTWNEVYNAISDIPAVEAVKVIRCSDCRHWEPECVEEGDSSGHCRNNYAPCQNQQTDMNWFCAEGERSDAP